MKHVSIVLVALALAAFSSAVAQSLRPLLPAGAVAVIGVQGLSQQRAKVQPFIDEFTRLGVGKAFQDAFASTEQKAEQSAKLPDLKQLPKQLQGLGVMDVIGDEAYLALSLSPSNPLPSVVFVARVDAKAQQAVAALLADEAKQPGVQKLTEGKLDFYVASLTGGSGLDSQIAYAQNGALVVVSNNPDVLRGVLRRDQGASEPNFTGAAGYQATLDKLGSGQLFTYLALAPVAAMVKPLLAAQGMDTLAQRLVNALDTLGTSASVSRITAAGVVTRNLRQLGSKDKDPALFALLSSTTPASTATLAFVPAAALSVSSSAVALSSWWSYLGDLVASAPQLGISDLNQFIQGMTGIDLGADLFDWTAQNVSTVTLPAPAPQQPGMPGSNLLGASVLALQAKDEAAAAQGLQDLFSKLAGRLAGFTNASGGTPPQPSTHKVGDATVTTLAMAPGLTLAYTVTGGHAFIATSASALDAVLQAKSSGKGLPAKLAAMRKQVPAGAHSFTLTDSKASVENNAAAMVSQLKTLAGMGASQKVDPAKMQAVAEALQKYLDFVASHLGGAVSYSQASNATITGQAMTQVSW